MFSYNTSQEIEGPVYIAVQAYPDMDAGTLADGLVLQSEDDSVTVEETSLGADGISAKYIYSEQETDGVIQVSVYYVVPAGSGSLLVEAVASLDPVTAKQVMDDFQRINREMHITVLINIHHVELALQYASRVVGIRAGEIVYDGPASQVDQDVLNAIYQGKQEALA